MNLMIVINISLTKSAEYISRLSSPNYSIIIEYSNNYLNIQICGDSLEETAECEMNFKLIGERDHF